MKKQLKVLCSLLLVLTIAFSLVACGSSEEEIWDDDKKPSQSNKDKDKDKTENPDKDGDSNSQPTDDKTYRIRTVEDLLALPKQLEKHVLDAEVVVLLENDLTVNDTSDFSTWTTSEDKRASLINWTPIKYFSGTFDGQGHTISGLYCCVDQSEDQYISAAFLYNLYPGATLENLNIADSLFYSAERRTTTVLTATNRGTVQNCHIRAEAYSNAMYISLLAGSTREGGQIIDCTVAGRATHIGSGIQVYVGGICSSLDGDCAIQNCVNYAELRGEHGAHIGGIVASAQGKVTGCANYGFIDNAGNDTGGIAASLSEESTAAMTYCVNYGKISNCRESGGVTAGIVARLGSGSVRYCENRGDIYAADDAGGVCGVVREEGVLSDCLNLGAVRSTLDTTTFEILLGGIVGENLGRVERCCNAAGVDSVHTAGGIAGDIAGNNAIVTQCWNFGESIGQKYAAGIVGGNHLSEGSITQCHNYGVSQAEQTFDFCDTRQGIAPIDCYSLQSDGYEQRITVSNFDFSTVWHLPESNKKYPTLRNLPTHPETSPLG